MIVCVDVGGTKTLLGRTELELNQPEFTDEITLETPKTYKQFLEVLQSYINNQDATIDTVSIAYPGRVNSDSRRLIKAQNIDWGEASVENDLTELLPNVKDVFVENDANLGGLAEATSGAGSSYETVYYLTVSTGIGGGYITNGAINSFIGNSEPGHMVVNHNAQIETWEEQASGKAFFDTYGQTAAETDPKSENWGAYVQALLPGFINIIALCNPKVIVVGGGVGAHFDSWWPLLNQQLQEHLPDFLELPDIKAAMHAERAVLEGAFYYARQNS